MKYIDLRSDTVTWPTEEMRQAMAEAPVGDDVYQDDPTINELQNYAASLAGKEAALFVPSGTFGNQLALFTHCRRGQEVVLDDDCHIVQHEAGAASIIAGVQLRTVTSKDSFLNSKDFEAKIRIGSDIHEPTTGLICIENARANGKVQPLSFMEEIKYISNMYHVPIHLDGARLFNAATFLNVPATEITKQVDSVMFCLSKGLCSPVGSILAGSAAFIEKARWNRKIMGGGMRQAGCLAAAGLISLRKMRLRLNEDHETALYLANELAKIPELEIDPLQVEINMVFFRFKGNTINPEALTEFMLEQEIFIGDADPKGNFRFVTHYWIHKEHIDKVIDTIKKFLA